jgi:hypothetical protein
LNAVQPYPMRAAVITVSLIGTALPLAFPAPAVAPPRPQVEKSGQAVTRVLEGITFETSRGQVFVPTDDLRNIVRLPMRQSGSSVFVGPNRIPSRQVRRLMDGTRVVSIRGLRTSGVPVLWDKGLGVSVIGHKGKLFGVRAGVKRIVVNRTEQRLRGWQGSRLVIQTNVSTGAPGFRTPRGKFTAGPFKAAMHKSRLYNDAPMPWTVQVIGNVCIHGSASVPRRPASHGCIRVPLTGNNPARFIYEWVNRGAAVAIRDEWAADPRAEG